MHLNEQLFGESAERLRKAQRNVQLAKQFDRMHPRARVIASEQSQENDFAKQLSEQTKKKASERPGQQQKQPEEKPDKRCGRQFVHSCTAFVRNSSLEFQV